MSFKFFGSALLLTAALCSGLSGEGWAEERTKVLVKDFTIRNEAEGPTITPADLARRVREDLKSTPGIDWYLEDEATTREVRYILRTVVEWVSAPDGREKNRLQAEWSLESTANEHSVARGRTDRLPLSGIGKEIAGAIPSLKSGRLSITTNQPGASVYLDNRLVGRTRGGAETGASFDSSGVYLDKYLVRLTHPDRLDVSEWVEVGSSPLSIMLEMSNRPAVVHIKTDAEEMEVYIDGTYKGMTPLRLEFAEGGGYDLTLKKSGREIHRRLNLDPHKETQVTFGVRTGEARVQAGPARLVKGSRIPFLYRDVHFGLSYNLGLPDDAAFEERVRRVHSFAAHLGGCMGFIGVRGEFAYGFSEYSAGGEGGAYFLDANGQRVEIDSINRVSGGGEIFALLPVGRRKNGRAIYPYGGVGYKLESIEVTPLSEWTSLDGRTREVIALEDAISLRHSYPYWTAGLVVGNLWLRVQRSIDHSEDRSGWTEASFGAIMPLSRN